MLRPKLEIRSDDYLSCTLVNVTTHARYDDDCTRQVRSKHTCHSYPVKSNPILVVNALIQTMGGREVQVGGIERIAKSIELAKAMCRMRCRDYYNRINPETILIRG